MSLEDPLLRIFAGERINRIMVMLKMPEGEAIEHAMVTRSLESAQRKVEAALKSDFNLDVPLKQWLEAQSELGEEEMLKRVVEKAQAAYDAKVPPGAEGQFRQYERYVMLQTLDAHWREHLAAL